jgi:hypothetical protein
VSNLIEFPTTAPHAGEAALREQIRRQLGELHFDVGHLLVVMLLAEAMAVAHSVHSVRLCAVLDAAYAAHTPDHRLPPILQKLAPPGRSPFAHRGAARGQILLGDRRAYLGDRRIEVGHGAVADGLELHAQHQQAACSVCGITHVLPPVLVGKTLM